MDEFAGKVKDLIIMYDSGFITVGALARKLFKLCLESGHMNLTHPAMLGAVKTSSMSSIVKKWNERGTNHS